MLDSIHAALPQSIKEPIRAGLGLVRAGLGPVRKVLAKRRQALADRQKELDRLARRRAIGMSYFEDRLNLLEKWIARDTENSNFYYDLADLNKIQLVHFVVAVTGASFDQAREWIAELAADEALLRHLQDGLKDAYSEKEIKPAFGRRLGWYAIARAIKPKTIVETGVDHGVGACVLTAALLRNAADGSPGRYYGLDILPSAGRLLTGRYAEFGEMVYGDAIKSLGAFPHRIDLFVNDSDHSADYERREYEAMTPLLNPGAVVIGDNSHGTDALAVWSVAHNRRFLFFAERPKDHWYPGAGIGVSF